MGAEPQKRRYNNVSSPPQVTRQVAKCKCPKRFQVEQIGANKYRVSGIFLNQQSPKFRGEKKQMWLVGVCDSGLNTW